MNFALIIDAVPNINSYYIKDKRAYKLSDNKPTDFNHSIGNECFLNTWNYPWLFKNQLLSREEYKKPTAFNIWFFGSGSDLDLSYDIPEHLWNRIKYTHMNLGYWNDYRSWGLQTLNTNKTTDLCAIFQAEHKYNEDHGVRNDLQYTHHRKGLWDKLQPLKNKYSMLTEKMPFQEYMQNLWNSKISLSPFGMGEFCFRDIESMLMGTIVLKPSHEKVDTLPNMMIDNETFIPCKYDWSDLEEKIDYILSNFNDLNEKINHKIRKEFMENFTNEKLCLYYYNLFSKLDDIGEEK